MAIAPIQAETFSEFIDECDNVGGAIVCAVVNYDSLLAEPHFAEEQLYYLSPRTIVLINEALNLIESRIIWTLDDGPPTDAEWNAVNADLEKAQLEMAVPLTEIDGGTAAG